MQQWFCVVSKPSQEARAAVELAKQDFRVYLPILDAKPMFPRYLFIQFDPDRDNWGIVRSTRGCIDLLRSGFIPTAVPAYLIEALMTYRPLAEPIQTETTFTAGQTIKVIEGPLQGLHGLFQQDAKKRTQAFIDIMGKRVELPKANIRAA